MTMLTLSLPVGQICLPLAGAQSLSYDLGEGAPDHVYAALSVIGMGDQASMYRSAHRRLDAVVANLDRLNAQAGPGVFFADGPEADALRNDAQDLRAECDLHWSPIQNVIDTARQAVEASGFDGAPA